MKRALRDVGIFLGTVFGVAWIYRHSVRAKGPLLRVIVFHDVHDREWFERLMEVLCAHYHVLTPADFFEKRFDANRVNVLVTFDDGYTSWVDVCLPVLHECNTKAFFFVNSGLLDVKNGETRDVFVRERLLLSQPHETLSWEGARALIRAGHTLGGHTISHRRLASLEEHTLRKEIYDDKKRIETMCDVSLEALAYPFGNKGDQGGLAAREARAAGYTCAFTTEGVFADMRAPYQLSRLCVEDGMSPRILRRWIEGGYDIYAILKRLCAR